MSFKPHTCQGHGGDNKGTLALGFPEKDYTFDIGNRLHSAAWSIGMSGSRSRIDDTDPSPSERGRLSARAGAGAVVIVHVNAGQGEYAHGVECYVQKGNKWSADVAKTICNAMPEPLRKKRKGSRIITAHVDAKDRITKKGSFWKLNAETLIKYHVAPIVVLVELGFATNDMDREVLLSEWGKQAVVAAMLVGVTRAHQIVEAGG